MEMEKINILGIYRSGVITIESRLPHPCRQRAQMHHRH